jgi:hypothetical protein
LPFHLARLDDPTVLSRRQLDQARKAEAATALEVHRYGLGARARADMSILDTQALDDANDAVVTSELDALDRYMPRVGTSATKVEIVARGAQRVAIINDRRLLRQFGR